MEHTSDMVEPLKMVVEISNKVEDGEDDILNPERENPNMDAMTPNMDRKPPMGVKAPNRDKNIPNMDKDRYRGRTVHKDRNPDRGKENREEDAHNLENAHNLDEKAVGPELGWLTSTKLQAW